MFTVKLNNGKSFVTRNNSLKFYLSLQCILTTGRKIERVLIFDIINKVVTLTLSEQLIK